MKEFIFHTEQTELEQFADDAATETFLPLWKNDELMLSMLECNPVAWLVCVEELSAKWKIPIEENADIQTAIRMYSPTEG